MPDQLLNLLKIFLLVLIYLFFLRVLRAVWAEIQEPTTVEAPERSRKGRRDKGAKAGRLARGRHSVPKLLVVAPAEIKGRAFPLGDEITVGRAAGCQVTLDDTYASQLHARVFAREGQWYVEDLGSTNGTYLNRRKVAGAMVMQRGDKLQIGNTVMELA